MQNNEISKLQIVGYIVGHNIYIETVKRLFISENMKFENNISLIGMSTVSKFTNRLTD